MRARTAHRLAVGNAHRLWLERMFRGWLFLRMSAEARRTRSGCTLVRCTRAHYCTCARHPTHKTWTQAAARMAHLERVFNMPSGEDFENMVNGKNGAVEVAEEEIYEDAD